MDKEKKQSLQMDNFSSTAELTTNASFQSSVSIAKSNDEKQYNPFEHRNLEHPNTTIGSILHLLKACLGSGILAMPAAFKNSGLVAGTIGTIIAGFICTHTVHILVKTSQEVCVDAKKPSMSFSETCGAAFTYGPKRLQGWSRAMKIFTDVSMALAYLGVLCVYVVFIATSFKQALDPMYPDYIFSVQMYCIFSLIPIVLICQIRNLKYLVPFSAIANVLILVVFAITMYYIFTDLPSPNEREMVASISQWPLFLSTVIFAMEGIGVVMPVENEMKNPSRFLGCPGVLNVAMVIVIGLYGFVGFFGYVQFGDDVAGSITLNLPEGDIFAQCAKLLMAVCIFLTYALQFYVIMEMVNRFLEKRGTNSCGNVIQIGTRTAIVVFTVVVAAAFPNLELVISLVGAVFFSTLGLLIPAVVDTVYHWDRDLGPLKYVLWKNLLIGLISIVALISGAYVSIQGMIEDFSGEPQGFDNITVT